MSQLNSNSEEPSYLNSEIIIEVESMIETNTDGIQKEIYVKLDEAIKSLNGIRSVCFLIFLNEDKPLF
jgi:hypothetical protein